MVKGADVFVDGAAALAGKFGIPQLVIGLTIVADGDVAAGGGSQHHCRIKGNAGITVGNIVGSNILNILIILGVTALNHKCSQYKKLPSNTRYRICFLSQQCFS